jgi:hypothetical protein
MESSPSIWILEDDVALCGLLMSRFEALGWTSTSLADLLEMDTDEFWAWFIEAQTVQTEIAKELDRK